MSKMLLINPRRRRRASAAPKRRRTSARRRRNPIATRVRSVAPRRTGFALSRRRRRNPISALRVGRRRRRNPIGIAGLNTNSLMAMFKDAAIGGAGAITMDAIMGQVNGFLPASFQTVPGEVSMGDAVKAGLTALLGQALSKSTKGLSRRMAAGALTVQAYDLMTVLVPSTLTMGRARGGIGFASPARVIPGSARVGPTRGGMLQAYQKPGQTALLNAYQKPGQTALLNRGPTAQQREGVSTYR